MRKGREEYEYRWQYRKADKELICDECKKKIEKGDFIKSYTRRRTEQVVMHLCWDCVTKEWDERNARSAQ